MKPLVSIIICAYNAEKTLTETLQSAVNQTWPRKEIIVHDDGSTDRTLEVARQFKEVKVVPGEHQGFAHTQNRVFKCAQGDYIQYLDADDLLASNKIEMQLLALRESDGKRKLVSSPWAPFYFRSRNAQWVRNSLWQDLSPVEWLLRKFNEAIHMQNATWLVSRELAEAAGPWDTRLNYDQDGEFFARVLLASDGTRFVPGTGIYYRSSGSNSISFIGSSNQKKESLLLSMKLHMQYLRSLEDSERVRNACLVYMQNWFHCFYPSRADLCEELQALAAQLQGHLEEPRLRWKYAWLKPVLGYEAAAYAQIILPQYKTSLVRSLDRTLFKLENWASRRNNLPETV